MSWVYVGIGSNIEPNQHIPVALAKLRAMFGKLLISPVYQSQSMGFDGDDFINLAAGFECDLTLAELSQVLKSMEAESGRTGCETRTSGRTLDIDILTFGDLQGEIEGVTLPRPEILYHAYVLRPLADIAADTLHPETAKTYRQLWQEFRRPQRVVLVSPEWDVLTRQAG